MNKYYVTFGQKSPFRNGWVEILAISEEEARERIKYCIGNIWSSLYTNDDFESDLFPAGKLGETI